MHQNQRLLLDGFAHIPCHVFLGWSSMFAVHFLKVNFCHTAIAL
jgi:hypothetical protein